MKGIFYSSKVFEQVLDLLKTFLFGIKSYCLQRIVCIVIIYELNSYYPMFHLRRETDTYLTLHSFL